MIDQMVYMHDVKKARKVLVYIRIPTPTRNVNPHHYYSHPHISSFMGSLKRFTLLKSNSFAKQNNPNFRLIGILDFFLWSEKNRNPGIIGNLDYFILQMNWIYVCRKMRSSLTPPPSSWWNPQMSMVIYCILPYKSNFVRWVLWNPTMSSSCSSSVSILHFTESDP